MNVNPKTHVAITVTDEHFLYLPLYYAQSKEFFDFLPNCEIEINPSPDLTDVSAFNTLMSADSEQTAVFALADPATALAYRSSFGPPPAILAAVITTAAFWAVDHRSREIHFLNQLSGFDSII